MQHWLKTFGDYLWAAEREEQSAWQKFGIRVGRLIYALSADIASGEITLRAMSLVFTTLLAIVPLLAVSFSVLKGFGVHNQIEPLLLQLLDPLGSQGVEITGRLIGFVENMRVGVLGSVGLALLFYSAFSLIQKVDQAFNLIWRLKKTRSLFRRLSDYLSALLIGPVLVFASMGISASLMSSDIVQYILAVEPLGSLYTSLVRLLPYLLIATAFAFFYIFIPNTKVQLKPAIIGGLVSGLVWQLSSWLFAFFILSSTKYTAVYSGFAILLFFMIWVYLNWLILLLGARLVYYVQFPGQLLMPKHRLVLSIADRENLALQALAGIGRAYYDGRMGATAAELNQRIRLPDDLLDEVLDLLKLSGLVSESLDRDELFLPACPFDETTIKQAMDRIRQAPSGLHQETDFSALSGLGDLQQRLDQQLQSTLGQVSLKQLALAEK